MNTLQRDCQISMFIAKGLRIHLMNNRSVEIFGKFVNWSEVDELLLAYSYT